MRSARLVAICCRTEAASRIDRAAITRFIGHLAEHDPLIVVLEDLHWADEMSVRLLAFLSRRIESWPVLLIGTAREEYLPDVPWLGKGLSEIRQHPGLVEIGLRPLSRSDTASLVRSVATTDELGFAPQGFEEHVWQVSEGNPFVALQTIRFVHEAPASGQSLARQLPTAVRDLVIGHLGRLSDRSRQLVGLASVVGREFDFKLLQCVAKLGDLEAAEAVEELVRRRIFHGVDERLDFTHDRIREAALSQLLSVQRRLLHREVGAALEAVYGENLEPHYAALAFHHREGEVFDKALLYLRKAAAQARTRFAYSQAAAFLEQALDVLRRVPETRETIEQAIDVRCDLRMSINPLADDRAMLDHLECAKSLAERIDDRGRLVRALTYLGREHMDLGNYAKSIEVEQEALAVAGQLGDRALEVAPTFYMALAYWRHGDLRRVCDIIENSVASIPEGQRPDHHGLIGTAAVFYRTLLARSLGGLGNFNDAIAWGKHSLRLAEAAGHPYGLFSAYLELGSLYVARGPVDEAPPLLEQSLDLARTRGIRTYVDRTAATLARAYALSGRAVEARALLETLPRESFSQRPQRSLDSLPLLVLGEAHLVLDRPDEAEWFAQRAIEMARGFSQREVESIGLRLLGDLFSNRLSPDLEKAAQSYGQALAIAAELGLRPLVAHCNFGLGKVARRRGERLMAQEHLTTAMAMYGEMGMNAWLAKAEHEERELR